MTMLLKSIDDCVDPSALAATAAVRQDEVDEQVNFEKGSCDFLGACMSSCCSFGKEREG